MHFLKFLGNFEAQERPRAPQELPRSAQEDPRVAPGGLPGYHGEPSGSVLRDRNSARALFECDLSRDSVENHIRNNFQSTFEACAQTSNLDFEATLQRFCRFFMHRLRASLPARAENHGKSVQIESKINQRSTKITLRSPLRAISAD